MLHFPTDYHLISERIEAIDAVTYGKTRNFLNGSVTYLSPYLARGVISLPMVKESILRNHSRYQSEQLMKELAWREYFQRVWQHLGDKIFSDIKQSQSGTLHQQLPQVMLTPHTGIDAIDTAIKDLYQTGYMHNHARMYTAMICCNIAKANWQLPAKWMYYHLLDGDLASNMLSWQWVAGTFSHKKYYANQQNINTYLGTDQHNTFLDHSYENIAEQPVPDILLSTAEPALITSLPSKQKPLLNTNIPLLLYNSYQLDPLWHTEENVNRVLVLEPSHFSKYPVSEKVLSFIIEIAEKNIPGIKVYVGEVHEIEDLNVFPAIYHKEHPTALHYPGIKEAREWMFPDVTGNYPGFFGFWKKCEKYL